MLVKAAHTVRDGRGLQARRMEVRLAQLIERKGGFKVLPHVCIVWFMFC